MHQTTLDNAFGENKKGVTGVPERPFLVEWSIEVSKERDL